MCVYDRFYGIYEILLLLNKIKERHKMIQDGL